MDNPLNSYDRIVPAVHVVQIKSEEILCKLHDILPKNTLIFVSGM